MNPIFLFSCNLLILLVAFRALSAPPTTHLAGLKIAIAVLVVFLTTIATLWFECSPWALLITAVAACIASLAIQGDGLVRLTTALGRYRFPIYILSIVCLAALVYLVVPITAFLSSPGEIGLHLDFLARVNARDAMIIVYAALALYAIAFTSRMRTLLALLALGALVLGLLYSFVLPLGYPMMTGLTFEQLPISEEALLFRALADLLLIVGVAFGLRFVLSRYGPRPVLLGLVAAGASLAAATVVSVQGDDIGGRGGSEDPAQLATRPLRFSPTHPNVLIVFLDRFMGSYIESILESDPQLAHRLDGFVWYPRTVAAGENSIAGVHPMLGGYDYTPEEMNSRSRNLRDLSVEAFSILPWNFSTRGFHVNFVNPRGLGFTMAGDCNYMRMDGVTCTHIPATVASRKAEAMGFPLSELSASNYSDLLVLLGSMRTAPYVVKEVLRTKGPWRPFMNHSAGTTFREWAELQALGELSETDAVEPNFSFVSNILPHEPYYMGENCEPQPTRFFASPEEFRARGHLSLPSLQHAIAARCALLGVAGYMDFLRNADVYDNTTIVVVSDHGIVGDVQDTSTRAVAGGTQANIYVRSRSLLMVKEPGASGTLRISEDFMPNAEVPQIVCRGIGGCVNPYLGNRPIETDGRNDPFRVSLVPWQFTMQNRDSFVIDEQMILRGKDPYDASGWNSVEPSGVH